jgi:hypothetical protein
MNSKTDVASKADSLFPQFMAMVGYCITDWALVEEELFGILHDVLGVSDERAAIIYLRTPTIEGRLSLINEIVPTTFPKTEPKNGRHQHKDLDMRDSILKEIRSLLSTRNRLAHSPVNAGL